jgi:hypothetical protein
MITHFDKIEKLIGRKSRQNRSVNLTCELVVMQSRSCSLASSVACRASASRGVARKIYTDAKLHGFNPARMEEKREEQKAQEASGGGRPLRTRTGRFFLPLFRNRYDLRGYRWGILNLFCIGQPGGSINFVSHQPGIAARVCLEFRLQRNAPVLIGLLAATAPIVMISMVWLPVQFAMRGMARGGAARSCRWRFSAIADYQRDRV